LRSRLVLVGACALVMAAAPRIAAAKDSVPDWVRVAASQKLPDYGPETNAVVLLDDIRYTVGPDGRAL
jgi:hypothetical protein